MRSFFPLLTLLFPILLIGCQGNINEKDTFAALSDSGSITKLTGDSVKLVKTASINFKVKDVGQSSRTLSGLTRKFGGMTYNQNMESAEVERNELKVSTDSSMIITTYTPRADFLIRIPAENLEDFLYSVADLGYFISNIKLQVDDKSLSYLENVLKQKNRAEVLSEPALKRSKSLTALQTVGVKDKSIEQEISNRAVDADVSYSVVNVSLFQNSLVRKEIIANTVISDYQLSFGHSLGNALKDGWQYFLGLVLVLAHLWMFILLAIALFFAYRYLQPKRKLTSLNVKPQ